MATTSATVMSPALKKRQPFMTTSRRQNHSCDRCRHGKRACDAVRSGNGDWTVCSNCGRLGTQCTFKWLQSSSPRTLKTRNKQSKRKPCFSNSGEPQQRADVFPTSRHHTSLSAYTNAWLFNSHELPVPSEEHETSENDPGMFKSLQKATEFALNTLRDDEACSPPPERGQAVRGGADQLESAKRAGTGVEAFELELDHVQKQQKEGRLEFLGPPAHLKHLQARKLYPNNRASQSRRSPFTSESCSPSSFGEVCRLTNKRMVSEGLLRIYHDSMENALSCWLTEKTCPYEIEGLLEGVPVSRESMSSEWGTTFSNRISTRVRNLDRASCSLRDRPMTPADERAASRVFDAATMSFASQWSHLSNHATTSRIIQADGGLSAVPIDVDATTQDDPSDFRGLFDRSVQEQLWHNAHRLLQETSGIDSFKVSFAHIIFAFTQRPLDMQKHLEKARMRAVRVRSNSASTLESSESLSQAKTFSSPVKTSADLATECNTSNSTDLQELINLEGPPIFLEAALRQLYTWRHRLEGLKTGNNCLSSNDRKTFNLLFWLGVMLETLSAAMNNRPLVVSDEDSAILRPTGREIDNQSGVSSDISTKDPCELDDTNGSALSPWGELFLRPQHNSLQPVIRWPCPYETAAQALCEAAPVKVLLFRKVTSLQSLAYRRASPNQMEESIQGALEVYSHWNSTYGPLIRDFIASHEAVPARLQSWYVVLTGHWHLAVFLLADLIETIDSQGHGVPQRRQLRESINLLLQIRKQSALEIAEVAQVSSPDTECSFYRTSAFHEHLNQGALLTEPWTDILIRSFGKACCLFLDWLQPSQSQRPSQQQIPSESLYASCASCIKGLRELGRKSDMARLVAITFAPRLEQLRGEPTTVYYPEG